MSIQIDSLFVDFARCLGIEAPNPLVFPLKMRFDDIIVAFEQRSDRPNFLLIHTSLGIVPIEHESTLYRAFLEANLFWSGTADATIGVNSATREAIIAYSFDFREIKGESLLMLVEQFTLLTELWLRFIESPPEAKQIKDMASKFKLLNN